MSSRRASRSETMMFVPTTSGRISRECPCARGGLLVWIAALLALLTTGSLATAQYCAPAVFLGDLNEDNLVDDIDMAVWVDQFNQGTYSACADINRNGILDTDDKNQLFRAVKFARTGSGGMGLQGRLPAFTISELRFGQPDQAAPQQRYVEFRVPQNLPANYNFSRQFPNGYYLILLARNNGTSITSGVIRQVINLQGVEFAGIGSGAGLALVVDSSFSLAFPAEIVPRVVSGTIDFVQQEDLNTTWLLVYRRPSGPGYNATIALPAVGQIVDRNQDCTIDNRFLPTFPSPPPPYSLPPWDVTMDAIAVDRSLITTAPGGRGCIYAHGPLYEMVPVENEAGELEAAWHVYRNSDDKVLSGIEQVVTSGIDTPGSVNPPSTLSEFCGAPGAGACSEVHATPYCADRECCEYVCALLPNCCAVAWDQQCVDLAVTNCGACGLPGTGACFSPHASPFCSSVGCCEDICDVNPLCCAIAWDASCVQLAIDICVRCGEPALGSCYLIGTTSCCNNLECCNAVCTVDPVCCSVIWDQVCVEQASLICQQLDCGSLSAGECCLSHGTPFCRDAECCANVCPFDPFCCEVVWDVQCVNDVLQLCPTLTCVCGSGGAGANCFMTHINPGCNTVACCNAVCNSDPFCCGVTWDGSCVAAAEVLCAQNPVCQAATGSCLVEHIEPGCSDPACCDNVCKVDPACCELEWDVVCVKLVAQACEGCGEVFAGSCTQVHKTPACDDAVCCLLVCTVDPFCCDYGWDSNCVLQAQTNCVPESTNCGDHEARSCFVASFLKGCQDPACCAAICDLYDTYCCTVQWDAICVGEALTFAQLGIGCDLPTGSQGRGDCLEAHATPGCADVDCSASVCSIDPNCCRIVWDASCAELAPYVCVTVGGCPGEGSPFSVHATPGSLDPSCCNAVCFVDPDCCATAWDQECVVLAYARCRPDNDWNVPCTGSCTEAHLNPGCDDIACASAVCFSDALCCTAAWDTECASLARGICCGYPGCGNTCNGPCLEPHESPYCADPYCCAAVCAEDPYCCSVGWDYNCVKFAYQRCGRGCGNPEAGACFSSHATAGCADALCCATVCKADSFCCEVNWDAACAEMAQKEEACQTTLECGGLLAGDCCTVHTENPTCRSAACCTAVCKLDPVCCDLAWDATCVSEAFTLDECDCVKPCGDLCAGDCCSAHGTPNCNDAVCCALVCAQDNYCCDTAWDVTCGTIARQLCVVGENAACPPPACGDADAGECCIPHLSPSCKNLKCCEMVCNLQPQCCEISWDTSCAELANTGCVICDEPGCGDPSTGSCFSPSVTPYCNQGDCCALICGKFQPECCSIAWDESCVKLATFICQQ